MAVDYEVVAYRDGKWWAFEIPALFTPSPRGGKHRIVAMGQSPTIEQIAADARDVIELWTEDDDFDLHIVYRLPSQVEKTLDHAQERERAGRRALVEASDARRKAIQALRATGLTQAETAAILGLSRQRVQQLAQ